MTESTYVTIIIFLGALLAGALWIVRAQGYDLRDMVDSRTALSLLHLGKELAERTPTELDDRIFAILDEVLSEPVASGGDAIPPTTRED